MDITDGGWGSGRGTGAVPKETTLATFPVPPDGTIPLDAVKPRHGGLYIKEFCVGNYADPDLAHEAHLYALTGAVAGRCVVTEEELLADSVVAPPGKKSEARKAIKELLSRGLLQEKDGGLVARLLEK